MKIVILDRLVNDILFVNENNIKHFNEVQKQNRSVSSNLSFRRVRLR